MAADSTVRVVRAHLLAACLQLRHTSFTQLKGVASKHFQGLEHLGCERATVAAAHDFSPNATQLI